MEISNNCNRFIVLLFVFLSDVVMGLDLVRVNLPIGIVEGFKNYTDNGNIYLAFKGIRYAERPQRFQVSTPIKKWRGPYNATYDKPVCVQLPTSRADESEDCLFLSVYVPKKDVSNITQPLSVMFWIHGGGFISGDSTYRNFGPDNLLDQGVIVVTTNYRLGVFGFASTGDEILPGNYGIKDLVLSLQWVQNYISYFGGNPGEVTIFGESAGGVLVSYLTQSPLTRGKGYFVRAISQSGNSLNAWGLQREPKVVLHTLATATNCLNTKLDWKLVVLCLKSQTLLVLRIGGSAVTGAGALYQMNIFNGIAFAPVIEPWSEQAAVVNDTHLLLRTGLVPEVPMMIGGTGEEGVTFMPAIKIVKMTTAQYDIDNTLLVPEDMHASKENVENYIAPRLMQYYFHNRLVALAHVEQLARFIGDLMFNKPLREYINLIKLRPKYCFVFTFTDYNTTFEYIGNAGHAVELHFLFKRAKHWPLTESGRKVGKKMATLWANYAKFGNPTPKKDTQLGNIIWPETSSEGLDISCMNINEELSIWENPFQKQYIMWRELYEEYGNPIDTY